MPRIVCERASSAACDEPAPRLHGLLPRRLLSEPDDLPAATRPRSPTRGLPVLDGGGSLSLQIYAAIYGLLGLPGLLRHHLPEPAVHLRRGPGRLLRARARRGRGRRLRALHERALSQDLPRVAGRAGASASASRPRSASRWSRRRATSTRSSACCCGCAAPSRRTPSDSCSADGPRRCSTTLGYDAARRTATDIETEIDAARRRIVDLESFFNQIIELERELGIQGFAYFGAEAS